MKFYSAFNRPKTMPVDHGDEFYYSFIEVLDPETGLTYLEESDRMDIKDYVKSFYEDTLIDNILARCARGDDSALNRVQGYYGDVTNVPTNIAELYASLKRCESDFGSLPVDLREKFDNNVVKFLQGFADGTVDQIIQTRAVQPSSSFEQNNNDVADGGN